VTILSFTCQRPAAGSARDAVVRMRQAVQDVSAVSISSAKANQVAVMIT
jgi:hypothetical protein